MVRTKFEVSEKRVFMSRPKIIFEFYSESQNFFFSNVPIRNQVILNHVDILANAGASLKTIQVKYSIKLVGFIML